MCLCHTQALRPLWCLGVWYESAAFERGKKEEGEFDSLLKKDPDKDKPEKKRDDGSKGREKKIQYFICEQKRNFAPPRTLHVFMSHDLCFPLTYPYPIYHSSSPFYSSPLPSSLRLFFPLSAKSSILFCSTGSQSASLKACYVNPSGRHKSLAPHCQTPIWAQVTVRVIYREEQIWTKGHVRLLRLGMNFLGASFELAMVWFFASNMLGYWTERESCVQDVKNVPILNMKLYSSSINR